MPQLTFPGAHTNARDFARRYAATHARASVAGGASTTAGARRAHPRGRGLARVLAPSAAATTRATSAARSGAAAAIARSAGSAGLATTTAWRRASTGHGVGERAHRDRLEQVGEDQHERALGRPRRGGTPPRSRSRRAAARGRAAPARRRSPPARRGRSSARTSRSKAIAPQRSPTSSATSATAASASSVASRTVPRGRSAPRRDRQRGGGEPAGVDEQHEVAVLLDAVLVAHRPPEPRGRAPVDLADVVVGQVVAHELEVGAEPERAARGDALLAELAAADREREPAGGGEVGVDRDLRGLARPVVPARRAAAARRCASPTAGSSWRPRRRATSVASSRAVGLARRQLEVRRRRLPDPHGRAAGARDRDGERAPGRRARASRGSVAHDARRAPHRARVDENARDERARARPSAASAPSERARRAAIAASSAAVSGVGLNARRPLIAARAPRRARRAPRSRACSARARPPA